MKKTEQKKIGFMCGEKVNNYQGNTNEEKQRLSIHVIQLGRRFQVCNAQTREGQRVTFSRTETTKIN